MSEWLAQHGLELALAIVSGSWFVSRTLVNFGAWKRNLELTPMPTPAHTIAEDRLQHELGQLAHKARSLIVTDLAAMAQRIEKKVDDTNAKSSEMWGKVQAKMGDLEIKIAKIETRMEERAG